MGYKEQVTRRVIMQFKRRQRGVSLIEVLIAVLIFSIGLIGLASLMMMAARSNHAAYQRTQVTFLADGMADRMRSNPLGLWNGSYNEKKYPVSGSTDCERAACSPASLATRDKQVWSDLLKTSLSDPAATVDCTTASSFIPGADLLKRRPPYGGHCAMTISWNERNAGDTNHSDTARQTFAWEFQP
jgi:type IV pilus assembly protein PilV